VEAGKEALKSDDASKMNAARDELMQAFSAAGQQVYQAQAAQAEAAQSEAGGADAGAGAQGEPEPSGSEDEDVVEADFEIVEDEKS
jgi:molecular chaperone DnaK